MRLLSQPEVSYDRALVLASEEGVQPARALIKAMSERITSVDLLVCSITDPSDHEALFDVLTPVVERLGSETDLDILLSAGTPQMQTLWVILVKAGMLKGRMLQVIPAAFVPRIHDRPIREVHLDIDGFPEIRALREEVSRLRARTKILGPDMVGQSKPMQTLVARMARVAPTALPVLIQGDTGTGKELVAQAIHKSSRRSSGPWIAENCGAFAEGLLVSELFGHVAGAFTGASHNKRGLFELANGGTLFLDEVGEMSPRVQINLLRVLQDGMIRRLGAESTTWVDVRVVAATHRDLSVMVKEGSFREDLYYRLRGATLEVPPLRERQADLELLIQYFLKGMKRELRISRDVWPLIRSYAWPGNVRELRAEVMRWHVFCDDVVVPADLSPEIRAYQAEPLPVAVPDGPQTLADAVAAAERVVIGRALATSSSNISRAARTLAVDRNTLKRKMTKYQLGVEGRGDTGA